VTGRSARPLDKTVLQHAGFRVAVPRDTLCCGRPLYDFGMLDRAMTYLGRILDALAGPLEAPVCRWSCSNRVVRQSFVTSCAASFRTMIARSGYGSRR
jgi:hypothetical protein